MGNYIFSCHIIIKPLILHELRLMFSLEHLWYYLNFSRYTESLLMGAILWRVLSL